MAEKDWELTVLSQLNDLGWELTNGTGIPPGTSYTERERATRKPNSILPTYSAFRHGRESNESLLIPGEIKDALRRLNPDATEDQLQKAYTTLTRRRNGNLVQDNNGDWWIRKGRVKLERRHRASSVRNIPLLPVPLAILKKYEEHPICRKKSLCLPVICNQRMNSYLKEIADLCNIRKNLTTHVAKHNAFAI